MSQLSIPLLAFVLAAGCSSPEWPADNVPAALKSPTHELTIKTSPTTHPDYKSFKVSVPLEASINEKYPTHIHWGDDTFVTISYVPDIKTDIVDMMKKSDTALRGQKTAPEGYAVVAPWRGTVVRYEGRIAWSLTYNLWNGKDFIVGRLTFAPNYPDSERRARAIFNSAIRTIKGV